MTPRAETASRRGLGADTPVPLTTDTATIIIFNVNSLRNFVKKPQALHHLLAQKADVLGFTEVRGDEEILLRQGVLDLLRPHYPHIFVHNQLGNLRGQAGVAICTTHRLRPSRVEFGFRPQVNGATPLHDTECRVLTAHMAGFCLILHYTPCSRRAGHPEYVKYQRKRTAFDNALRQHASACSAGGKTPLILAGDFNVAPGRDDFYLGHRGFAQYLPSHLPFETSAYTTTTSDLRLWDPVRHFLPKDMAAQYTWFKSKGHRERRQGWRLDHFLLSQHFRSDRTFHLSAIKPGTGVLDVDGSDHKPIQLCLAFSAAYKPPCGSTALIRHTPVNAPPAGARKEFPSDQQALLPTCDPGLLADFAATLRDLHAPADLFSIQEGYVPPDTGPTRGYRPTLAGIREAEEEVPAELNQLRAIRTTQRSPVVPVALRLGTLDEALTARDMHSAPKLRRQAGFRCPILQDQVWIDGAHTPTTLVDSGCSDLAISLDFVLAMYSLTSEHDLPSVPAFHPLDTRFAFKMGDSRVTAPVGSLRVPFQLQGILFNEVNLWILRDLSHEVIVGMKLLRALPNACLHFESMRLTVDTLAYSTSISLEAPSYTSLEDLSAATSVESLKREIPTGVFPLFAKDNRTLRPRKEYVVRVTMSAQARALLQPTDFLFLPSSAVAAGYR
jgi:exodeoxyribonuclease III